MQWSVPKHQDLHLVELRGLIHLKRLEKNKTIDTNLYIMQSHLVCERINREAPIGRENCFSMSMQGYILQKPLKMARNSLSGFLAPSIFYKNPHRPINTFSVF